MCRTKSWFSTPPWNQVHWMNVSIDRNSDNLIWVSSLRRAQVRWRNWRFYGTQLLRMMVNPDLTYMFLVCTDMLSCFPGSAEGQLGQWICVFSPGKWSPQEGKSWWINGFCLVNPARTSGFYISSIFSPFVTGHCPDLLYLILLVTVFIFLLDPIVDGLIIVKKIYIYYINFDHC